MAIASLAAGRGHGAPARFSYFVHEAVQESAIEANANDLAEERNDDSTQE